MAVADHIVELGSLAVADPRVDELVIDLSRVTFLDSRGVGALVHLRNHAVTTDKRVALRRIPPTALKVLMLTDVGPSFGLTDTDTWRC